MSCESKKITKSEAINRNNPTNSCSPGRTMRKNAAVTVVCIMMCFTVNYTFPLHRRVTDDTEDQRYANGTESCDVPLHRETIAERSKKMASNIGNAIMKIKDSTQDLGRNIYDHVSSGFFGSAKRILNEDDLRQYEQMVIMKKYPYLDLKDLEQKYSPAKQLRQSQKFEHDQGQNVEGEPGIYEPGEELPNVEITNRGLTGFAIRPELSKHVSVTENKAKENNLNPNDDDTEGYEKFEKKSSMKEMLGSLKNEIKEYVDKKNKE